MPIAGIDAALREVERCGLLMLADAKLSSLTTLIAGEPVRGSWWSHPRGKAIFAVSSALAEHDDVVALKLVASKVTFIHRKLWPSLLAVVTAREPWQTSGLAAAPKALLAASADQATVRCDDKVMSAAAGELEARLLARIEQVHTERGVHALQVESWERWAKRKRVAGGKLSVAGAKRKLELATAALGADDAIALLPWNAVSKKRRR